MKAIGVLSTRTRVEEKQIIAALVEVGLVAVPVPPAGVPLPPGPASAEWSMLGGLLDATTGETIDQTVTTIIDRTTNRAVTSAMLPLVRMGGVRTIDAGLAAIGTRLQVASALAAAGLPRPYCLVGFSEETGMLAANQVGYPSTLLGLTPGEITTPMHDRDTADAVIEHRVVLGQDAEAVMLVQAGIPKADERTVVHVVGGKAIAWEGTFSEDAFQLGERASVALDASLVAVEIVQTANGLVVWDVLPVGEFRTASLIGEITVAGAIAGLCTGTPAADPVPVEVSQNGWERTVPRGYALSA